VLAQSPDEHGVDGQDSCHCVSLWKMMNARDGRHFCCDCDHVASSLGFRNVISLIEVMHFASTMLVIDETCSNMSIASKLYVTL